MSRSHHAQLMLKLFAQLGVQTSKVTHELRIFAAQVMFEMGVPLEVRTGAACWAAAGCNGRAENTQGHTEAYCHDSHCVASCLHPKALLETGHVLGGS